MLDICHVRMTDIEGFLTIYAHSDNLLNNNDAYVTGERKKTIITNTQSLLFNLLRRTTIWQNP